MKTTLINSMVSFTLGTGATLVALSSWLGTGDLQAIKNSVEDYIGQAENTAIGLVEDYNVVVDEANAEIGEYKVALQKANDNIFQLATAYEQQQAKYEADMTELQAEYDEMVARMEQQYETDMNAVIEQANEQINQANEEVAQTKEEVNTIIEGSHLEDIINEERNELDTTGDKTVTEVFIVPQEEQGE